MMYVIVRSEPSFVTVRAMVVWAMRNAHATIGPRSTPETIHHYIEREHTEAVRDPLWGHMYLSAALMRVIDTEPFHQLARIKQLGPTFIVYPGATHTRFAHSLGVFHIAKRIILRLLGSPDAPMLSVEGVKAYLAAALLHDVGHFPYTHSFKRLPLADHEQLTGALVRSEPIASRLREGVGVDPYVVAAIVDQTLDDHGIGEIALYRRLLSGSLDPDKLDYLNRDAYYCGVPYGIQDIDYALSRIVPNGYNGIALDSSGLSAVENILFSKYLMYRAVYWHRTVRVATAMIKKAVYLGLREGRILPEELYGLDDESFVERFDQDDFEPFRLVTAVGKRRLFRPVADLPFDAEAAAETRMGRLDNLEDRSLLERELALELRAQCNHPIDESQVVIDVPDPISFEASFPIFDNGRRGDFASESVFAPHVVRRFAQTLRRVRLMLPESIAERMEHPRELLREFLAD